MKLATFARFKKIMARTTSDNDHEALAALRAANALLKEESLTWERVLSRSINVIQEVEQAPDDDTYRHHHGAPSKSRVQVMLDAALLAEAERKAASIPRLSRRSREFVESIHTFFEEKGYLTDGQRDAIKGFVESP
jgi:hypothetical protein